MNQIVSAIRRLLSAPFRLYKKETLQDLLLSFHRQLYIQMLGSYLNIIPFLALQIIIFKIMNRKSTTSLKIQIICDGIALQMTKIFHSSQEHTASNTR
jgi:hypothetical protein